MVLTQFDSALFLREYWQKKPCVIKGFATSLALSVAPSGALCEFDDPIDEHDLAGLAQEPEVDSRIVANVDGEWRVSQGPFAEFETHCVGNWSLLVQGVDKYIDDVNALTELVNFIPHWRLDDIMVSFSTPNAGVGPHTDEYDVFIVQGKGKRRWQVGLPQLNDAAVKEVLPHPLLKQIESFNAVIDEVLLPGDAVYIPPKHPHNGVALSECINYSIGFRAPTNLESLHGILDYAEALDAFHSRYEDPDIHVMRNADAAYKASAVTHYELDKLKAGIANLLASEHANEALLKYLSLQQLPDLQGDTDNESGHSHHAYNIAMLQSSLHPELLIVLNAAVRPIYLARQQNASVFTFYIDTQLFEIDLAVKPILVALFENKRCNVFSAYELLLSESEQLANAFLALLVKLLQKAYVSLEG